MLILTCDHTHSVPHILMMLSFHDTCDVMMRWSFFVVLFHTRMPAVKFFIWDDHTLGSDVILVVVLEKSIRVIHEILNFYRFFVIRKLVVWCLKLLKY